MMKTYDAKNVKITYMGQEIKTLTVYRYDDRKYPWECEHKVKTGRGGRRKRRRRNSRKSNKRPISGVFVYGEITYFRHY